MMKKHQQHLLKGLLNTLEHIEYGSLCLNTPDGKSRQYQGKYPGKQATFHIYDWRCLTELVVRADVGLTEAYQQRWWDSDHLVDLFIFGLENERVLNAYLYGHYLFRWANRWLYFLRANTIRGSRRNIQAHYDLGNAFYQLWLDPSMTYSSALFDGLAISLEQAQYGKYDRILSLLGSQSGRLLEIGSGWGGFVERALLKYDYEVTGITISKHQYEYSKQRLGHRASILREDYRKQTGKYDHIVSIEMFEAVGERFWPVYFKQIKSLLSDTGRAVIQTIVIDEPYFERYKKGVDMIRTYIFHGGILPSLKSFERVARQSGLKLMHSFAFGPDYAHTLTHWLNRFEEKLPQVRALGFDEAFIRTWRFYLSTCIAGFKVGRTNVMQIQLQPIQ